MKKNINKSSKGSKIFSSREENEMVHFDKMSLLYDDNYGYNTPFTQYKINKKSKEFVKIANRYCESKNPLVVELGAGTGEYTVKIALDMPQAKFIAVDISKNILDVAKKKCKKLKNVTYLVKSAYDTKLKANSADIVCGFYALHHFDVDQTAREASRLLKKGGLLFFYEPNILNPLVYLIKSNKILKKMAGDSPDEWGINPLTIESQFPSFKLVVISSSEYMWPLKSLPFTVLKFADKLTSLFKFIPFLNLLGGSLIICLQKK